MFKLMMMSLRQDKPFPIPVVQAVEAPQRENTKIRECVACGCKFVVPTEAPSSKTCSRSCSLANRRAVAGAKYVHRKVEWIPCVECGTKFEQLHPRVITCSDQCNKERHVRLKRERRHKFATL